ncbi:carotenoid biosynthesis protein [Truepera radiovictrix]|uniref:carotenoid biosynthesis protein n=1 Tax=Truepera radiovictrix TaxID=332249 RepID=UPI0003042DFB|nr:carotenoid biosynthesis protein [Truepera radiovictrix]WMT56096.1 carotenoid biosynthesis protein [Truepera radiovictrix]
MRHLLPTSHEPFGAMTYLQFHLVFLLPPLLLLGALTRRAARRGELPRFGLAALALHALVAFLYTTPWDNYLVARGVWGYGAGRVLFTVGWVPFEEYLFFILQTLLTGTLTLLLGRSVRLGPPLGAHTARLVQGGGALAWLLLAAAGVLALSTERGTYFGLIAAWAAPVLALQWGFGGDLLVRRWRWVLPSAALPTLYLWLADRVALGAGIWWISPALSTGWRPLGLPVEEALFFLLTNLLIVFGMTLALAPESLGRLRALAKLRWWRVAFVLWVLTMVPTPLLPGAFVPLAYLSTLLLTLGVLGCALERYGRRAWSLFALAFLFGVVVEWLGYRTGVPFGAYRYTAPGPALLGVPLLVPLGWFAFTMIALALAPRGSARWFAPLVLVAWDVGLDPLMVSQGFWAFASGAYYGVPLSNFVGWYAAGWVLVALLLRLEPRLETERPRDLHAVFWVQLFLMTFGLLFFGLPWAALAVLVAMGAVGIWAAFPQQTTAWAVGGAARLKRAAQGALVALIARCLPWIIRRSLRRGLHGVYARGPWGALPKGGFILAANHHAWWDPYLAWFIGRRLGRPLSGLMLDATVERFPFFRAHGALKTTEVREALRRLARGEVLILFPEGVLRPPGQVSRTRPGVLYLARRAGVPVVPLAIRVTVRGAQHPEALLSVGAPLEATDAAALEGALNALLGDLDDLLRRAEAEQPPPGFTAWLGGAKSTHERAAWVGRVFRS